MTLARVGARCQAGGEAAVNVAPVVGTDFLRRKTEQLDGVDRSEHRLDLLPAESTKQNFCARLDARDRGARLSVIAGAQNVDAGNSRAAHWRPSA